ncbi:ABC transporter permease [Salinirubrum litoreum]|uniref:ABC transporter permease n=1 Tax=Salinirubrum litoreum TaxID=1126234 RepID=A0ABD5R9I9_9EURY|nr:ABC transporter permease [Salinirubrum litoreum]
MADPRLTIAGRELRVLGREKTIVLALLIQLFIAAFSSFLVVGLVSLYDPGSVEGYEVEVAVTGDARADLLDAVRETPSLGGEGYDSRDAALTAFENGQVDAVLATETVEGRVQVEALAPDSNVRTTLVVVQLRDALRAFERGERADRAAYLDSTPLDLPPEGTSSPYYSFTYTVLVPLLLFLPVFISGSIAVDSLTEEFERGTLELLRVAPISLLDIVDGKLLAAAVLAPAQAGLWIALLRFNGTAVSNPVVLIGLVAAFSLLVVGLGSAVGLLAPDRRAAQFLYSIGVLAVFGGATLLPGSPANTVAKLAIGSADAVTYLTVAGYGVLAVGAYLLVRVLVTRYEVVSA